MKIHIRLFASLRERLGHAELDREIPAGANVGDLLAALKIEFPALAGCGRVAYAVNSEYTDADQALADGDELALIPPVSGGCDKSTIS
ncbi:MAG: molybdopterin converting factor subunit 1 [Deltaproteobacteria bacterium]